MRGHVTFWTGCLLLCMAMLAGGCHERGVVPGEVPVGTAAKKVLYTCSMHPQIVRDEPGNCPICGMKLVRMETEQPAVEGLSLKSLLRPTNQFVVSEVPVTRLQQRVASVRIAALGKVTYDTREERTVAARVAGRIEKLYVRYRFQHIRKGQPLLEIYSPELLTAQQNLLFLRAHDAENVSLLAAAREKLLLLGMSDVQLRQVELSGKPAYTVTVYSDYTGHIHEAGGMASTVVSGTMKDVSLLTEELPLKEGMYVEKGQTIFSVYNPAKAWALLNIYAGDQAGIKAGDVVSIVPETDSRKVLHGVLNFVEPFYRNDSKTLTARVYFDNSRLQIPIGSQVTAQITGSARHGNWLPREAVVSLGLDNVVFVKSEGGFRAQKVVTGVTQERQVQVLSGLDAKDEVAVNAQYLVDSESFIKTNNE